MNPRKIAIQELTENGYILKRQGGDHMIFFNPETKTTIPIVARPGQKSVAGTGHRTSRWP